MQRNPFRTIITLLIFVAVLALMWPSPKGSTPSGGSTTVQSTPSESTTIKPVSAEEPKTLVQKALSFLLWILVNFGMMVISAIIFLLVFRYFMNRNGAGGIAKLTKFDSSNKGTKKGEKDEDFIPKVTFADVGGVGEALEEMREIVQFLKTPEKFKSLGAKMPKGVMLVGGPGVGKTLLARAIAGEAKVPFFPATGSDFVYFFVGAGASRVRDLFETAKAHAPCIVFIDEIESVGGQRGQDISGEYDNTTNQLLSELDGFEGDSGVLIIGATNRPDMLDAAFVRSQRFDRQIVINSPDLIGRREILGIHARGKKIEPAELEDLARRTIGFSGADLATLLNEAALLGARRGASKIEKVDLDNAYERLILGPEQKRNSMSPEEKKITAYHEVGHTVVAFDLKQIADPLYKVSIVPRGQAAGVTSQLPERDRVIVTREYLEAELAILLGGRAAEEVFLKVQTSGAANDLERASELSKNMVANWGMSDLGLRVFKATQEWYGSKGYSEASGAKIDEAINALLDTHYKRAKQILTNYREKAEQLVKELLEKETLNAAEITAILS